MSADDNADNDYDRDKNHPAAVFRPKETPTRRPGSAARLRPIKHRVPLYCLDFVSGEIKSAPARKAPESPERIGRTPGISSALVVGAADPDCGPALGGAALAVSSVVIGVAAPDVPGGGLGGDEPGLPGIALGAVELLGAALFAGGALPDEFDEEVPPGEAPCDEAPDETSRRRFSPSLKPPLWTPSRMPRRTLPPAKPPTRRPPK